MFSGCTVVPDRKETKLGSSDQDVSPSAGKNMKVDLLPCGTWKCVPTVISGVVDISEVPGCSGVLSEVRKNYFKGWCFMNS